MLNKPLGDVKDKSLQEHLRFIQEEGQGKIIELSAAPTATAPLISPDEWGVYDSKLYHRVGDVIFRFDPDATTTVTV